MYSSIRSVFFAILAGSIVGYAAPFDKRQVGDLECNLDRAGIIIALLQMNSTLNDLSTQVEASDPSDAMFASQAQGGLGTAAAGVESIVQALVAGQNAPADARVQVSQGLDTMFFALGNITSTDATVQSTVAKAQAILADASTEGNGVLQDCN